MVNERVNIMSKRHISYFQSVITLGILTEGETKEEAISRASRKMEQHEGVDHCFFDQTPFENVATEEWSPELESKTAEEGLSFNFNPSDKTKNVIATRLQKDVDELTDEDYELFIKESLQKSLELS